MTKAVLSVSRFLNATITAKKIQVFLRFTAPEKALSQQPAVSLRMSPSVCSRIRHSDRTLNPPTIPGATGEVLQNMLAIGALPIQLDQIQLGPWSSPDERGFGLVSQFNTIAGFPKGIMVDKRTGRRFVNELADRKARSDAILKQLDENGKPFTRFASPTASASNRLRH